MPSIPTITSVRGPPLEVLKFILDPGVGFQFSKLSCGLSEEQKTLMFQAQHRMDLVGHLNQCGDVGRKPAYFA